MTNKADEAISSLRNQLARRPPGGVPVRIMTLDREQSEALLARLQMLEDQLLKTNRALADARQPPVVETKAPACLHGFHDSDFCPICCH